MMLATGIKMSDFDNDNIIEIEKIYIHGCDNPRWYTRQQVYDAVEKKEIIKVNIGQKPKLVCDISDNGDEYVRSEFNETKKDNLLELPRYPLTNL